MENMKTEFQTFNDMMKRLVKVPHAAIKSKLEAEKAAKKQKSKPQNERPKP
ncbi:MAG: hypothetical protein LAO03_22740 [Acidobacteriia bacterium]|nr:hypothetical protein [Terriglobia bacterium]